MAKEKSLTHKIFQENEMGKYEVASEIENQEKSVKNLSVFFREMRWVKEEDLTPFLFTRFFCKFLHYKKASNVCRIFCQNR